MRATIIGVAITLFVGCGVLRAQGNYGPTDGLTQTSVAPGTPETSYALSGLDNINYYNVSVRPTPLLTASAAAATHVGPPMTQA